MEAKTVAESDVKTSQIMTPLDVNSVGNVHGGVIMRLVDTTAALVAMRHARSNVVTASIDRMDFHNPVFVGDLVTFKASLNMAGKTSMEVGVRVEREQPLSGETKHVASAYLTMVAMGEDRKPQPIPPLTVITDEEIRRNREAINRREARFRERQAK
jgi:uncharacterized protein (TIGR00369 family)